MRSPIPLVLLLLLAVAGPVHAQEDERARFEAAMERVGADDGEAARRLEELSMAVPPGEFADDALLEAARLAEERLGRPDRARDLYARLVAEFPDSRLALRARARLDFLDGSLRTGAAPLAEYQDILLGYAARGAEESAARMERLLREHPEFARAAEGLLWLGNQEARMGRTAAAERHYLEVEARFPGEAAWAEARRARAQLALNGGQLGRAQALFRSILDGATTVPTTVVPTTVPTTVPPEVAGAARDGLDAVGRARWRRGMGIGSLAFLVAYGLLLLVAARPLRVRPAPLELWYYLPVGGLFVVAGLTENPAITWATGGIASGGAVLVWLTALAGRGLLARGALGAMRAAGLAVGTLLAVAAITWLALDGAGLLDFVVETLRSGPER